MHGRRGSRWFLCIRDTVVVVVGGVHYRIDLIYRIPVLAQRE